MKPREQLIDGHELEGRHRLRLLGLGAQMNEVSLSIMSAVHARWIEVGAFGSLEHGERAAKLERNS